MRQCGGLEGKMSNMESLRRYEGLQMTLSAKMPCDWFPVCSHIIELRSATVLKNEGIQIPLHQLMGHHWEADNKDSSRKQNVRVYA